MKCKNPTTEVRKRYTLFAPLLENITFSANIREITGISPSKKDLIHRIHHLLYTRFFVMTAEKSEKMQKNLYDARSRRGAIGRTRAAQVNSAVFSIFSDSQGFSHDFRSFLGMRVLGAVWPVSMRTKNEGRRPKQAGPVATYSQQAPDQYKSGLIPAKSRLPKQANPNALFLISTPITATSLRKASSA